MTESSSFSGNSSEQSVRLVGKSQYDDLELFSESFASREMAEEYIAKNSSDKDVVYEVNDTSS